ncbi:MAG: YceD family protein [Chloroflexota bacterium]
MIEANDLLRLNVGFIIHETIGYSREFPLEAEKIRIPPDLELENMNGAARVTRTAQGLLVQVTVSADVPAECVRCLEAFPQRLEADFTDLYAFTPDSVTESGLRVPETGKINLAPIIREELLLALPISPVCREDCLGLCLVCGENLNTNPHQHPEDAGEA